MKQEEMCFSKLKKKLRQLKPPNTYVEVSEKCFIDH